MTARKSVRRGAKKESATRPATGSRSGASGSGKAQFDIIAMRLKFSSKRRAYVPPEQIAQALRENPGIPLPPDIHDYLCDLLEGKIQAPAGRPPDIEKPLVHLKKILIPLTYARYFAWLQRRERSIGLDDLKLIPDANWWQGPPHERAARITCRALRLAMDWRRVLNIVSEANK